MCIGAYEPGFLPRSSEPRCLHFEGDGDRDSDTRPPGSWLRGGTWPGGGRLPRADGLQRGRLPEAGRGATGPSADAEEPDRGAAPGCPRRTGDFPPHHRGGSRRSRLLDAASRPIRGEVRDRGQALPRLPATGRRARGSGTTTTASRPSRAGARTSARPRLPTSWSRCASRRPRPSGARSSTRPCSRPRPGSTRRMSRSPRGATPARSRSRDSTTAAARTGGSGCSRSRRRARATRFFSARRRSDALRARSPAGRSATSGVKCRMTPSSRIGGAEARLHLTSPRP